MNMIIHFYRFGADPNIWEDEAFTSRQEPKLFLCNVVGQSLSPEGQEQKSKDTQFRIQNYVNEIASQCKSKEDAGEYVVDNVVYVSSQTKELRAQKKDFWGSFRTRTILIGIASSCAAVGAGFAFTIATVPVSSIALAVAAVAFTIFALFNFYRAHQAQHQVNCWKKDPAQHIAQLRSRAYGEGGFLFSMKQGLKEASILHPAEVTYLFVKSLNTEKEKFVGAVNCPLKVKKVILKSFFEKGLLDAKALAYAYAAPIPLDKRYKELKSQMEKCRTDAEFCDLFAKAQELVIQAHHLATS